MTSGNSGPVSVAVGELRVSGGEQRQVQGQDSADSDSELLSRVPAPRTSIADQLIRSAGSVPANLAEGHGRSGRDRQHHWRIAHASAKEVDSHLRLLAAAGAVDGLGAEQALGTFDEVRAKTWRLLNPC
jgi:four helix bundle protein